LRLKCDPLGAPFPVVDVALVVVAVVWLVVFAVVPVTVLDTAVVAAVIAEVVASGATAYAPATNAGAEASASAMSAVRMRPKAVPSAPLPDSDRRSCGRHHLLAARVDLSRISGAPRDLH
jgi:hypothetical protein